MMKHIYFDNAATTAPDPEVLRVMHNVQEKCYGNPSSIHGPGRDSKVLLEKSRKTIARYIGAQPREIIFTSGGTESDNLAIIGAAKAHSNKGNKIISTKIEHTAVLRSLEYLSEIGFDIHYVNVDQNGHVDLSQLEKNLDDKTILVTMMLANNETGHILDIKPVADLCRKNDILFHSDAVQALGKMSVNMSELDADMVSLSAHKIYGPKGVGVLYLKSGMQIDTQVLGGSQEANRRGGTENLAAIAGLAKAIELLGQKPAEVQYIRKIRDAFEKKLQAQIPEIDINGANANRLCSHANIYFPVMSGESMLMHLDMHKVAVSTGAACSSGSTEPSHVLQAMNYEDQRVENSVRFSFGRFNTMEDIDKTVEIITQIYKQQGASHGND